MANACETGSCASNAPAKAGSCCTCGPANCLNELACKCPIEGAVQMWAQSFGEAMRQAQVDLLKAKILKAWGPMMDQAADGMIETMGAMWQTKIAEIRTAEAKQGFQQRLRDLWLQDKKK